MNEKKKHKIMLGIEVILFCMIVAILGTNAASSNPPSNGVSYGKNNQTTVEGALNDLYTKANYGNASASQILSGKTALVGGSKVTGTMANQTGATGITLTSSDKRPIKKVTKQAGDARIWHVTNSDGVSRLAIGVPASGYYDTNVALAIENADLASAIGLTANKIIKGQTVLGITGTGETTCPTCESQGYWKVYRFENLEATCTRNDKECLNSWFTTAKTTVGKDGGYLTYSGWETYIVANLDLDYKQILSSRVDLTCPAFENCFRMSTQKSEAGGADKTTSATYLGINGSFDTPGITISDYRSLSIGSSDYFDGTRHAVDASFSNGKIQVKFVTVGNKVGTYYNPIELKGKSYFLSGYIVYR